MLKYIDLNSFDVKYYAIFLFCFLAMDSIAVDLNLNSNSNSPIEILADEVYYYHNDNKAVFKGKVIATQDDLVIKSELVEVVFAKNKMSNTRNNMDMIYFKQGIDIKIKAEHATADWGEYNVITQRFKLIDNVMLKQLNGNIIRGDELIYMKSTGETLLKSNKNSRVKARLMPTAME